MTHHPPPHLRRDHQPALRGVVVADDDRATCERISESLRAQGLTVVPANNGQKAIDAVRAQPVDLVVLAVDMPGLNGIEATRRICAEFSCAILVVTATVHGHAGRVFEAMGAGALDAVNTPVLGNAGQGEGDDTLVRKIYTIAKLFSRHKVPHLKGAGIVRDDRRGVQVFYRLRVPCILNFFGCVEAVLEEVGRESASAAA